MRDDLDPAFGILSWVSAGALIWAGAFAMWWAV